MKFLFFDVECSNCFNGVGKICEFGYVLTDDKFNIIKADDIPMSPGRGRGDRFNLTGRKNERDLVLAYDYEYYFKQPEFPHFYKRIKELMCDEDTICFAYSMDNDIRHIHNTCMRYGLKTFDYVCYDVQMLASKFFQEDKLMSLEIACRKIVGPNSTLKLQAHLSRDDAKMEMMILNAICELDNKDVKTLLGESLFAKTRSSAYMKEVSRRKDLKKQKNEGRRKYNLLLADESLLDLLENKGKRYNVSNQLKSHPKEFDNAVGFIKSRGGLFTKRIAKTDFYIVFDENNGKQFLEQLCKEFNGVVMTYKELINE